jgi:hypothetical protein
MKRYLTVVALLVGMAAVSQASTFVAQDQQDLVRASSVVLQGEVLDVASYWTPKGEIIVSEATILVEDRIVGNAPSVVVVRTFGGTVNGYTVEAHGFPTFAKGERQLLYLEPDPSGALRVAGYQQGQYRIVRDKSGAEIAVSAVDTETNLVRADGRAVERPKQVALEGLKELVRATALQLGRPVEN